ncbi:MAG: ankyrin repeat domain-containing protein [Planctomycetes bacterium]|nr:ankyrin repeat domain-containing protein [Planctomycetota bacterium]
MEPTPNPDLLARVAAGRTDLVFALPNAGIPVDATFDGGSLLAWCARYGDVSAIRLLLERGAALSSLGTDLGLAGAAFHGHWRLCEYLIEQGADPRFADPLSGETPLHAALCTPNRPAFDRVVDVLLAAGADPDAVTTPGVATDCFMRDVRTRGESSLHRAAAFGSEHVIRALLAAGAKRERRDANGDTPLGWASWHRRPDAVLRLLCFGEFRIHPDRDGSFDHGRGWSHLECDLLGRPTSSVFG